MINNQLNGNNGRKPVTGPLDNEKLKFPVSYRLKAVLEASLGEEADRQNLETVFESVQVPYTFYDFKLSTKGKYISYTYQVTLQNKSQMLDLYDKLKGVEGLKFAL